MPAYFSMTLLFENSRLKPNFVYELYSQIISNGFTFKSGYWFHKNAKLNEITEWNQKLLDSGFQLGFTQHVRNDYMQILFKTEHYSELRGFWTYSGEGIAFNLIIPEHDILNCEGGDVFIDTKIHPMKQLALMLWKSNCIDAIQTNVELDEGYYHLKDIKSGKNISVNPFAIINQNVFNCFSNDYFKDKNILEIDNGMFIENDRTILYHF